MSSTTTTQVLSTVAARGIYYRTIHAGNSKGQTKTTHQCLHLDAAANNKPCGKYFTRSNDAVRHYTIVHAKVLQFYCQWDGCTYNTGQASALNTHMGTHTKELKYFCRKCARGFVDPSSCSRHEDKKCGIEKTPENKRNAKGKKKGIKAAMNAAAATAATANAAAATAAGSAGVSIGNAPVVAAPVMSAYDTFFPSGPLDTTTSSLSTFGAPLISGPVVSTNNTSCGPAMTASQAGYVPAVQASSLIFTDDPFYSAELDDSVLDPALIMELQGQLAASSSADNDGINGANDANVSAPAARDDGNTITPLSTPPLDFSTTFPSPAEEDFPGANDFLNSMLGSWDPAEASAALGLAGVDLGNVECMDVDVEEAQYSAAMDLEWDLRKLGGQAEVDIDPNLLFWEA